MKKLLALLLALSLLSCLLPAALAEGDVEFAFEGKTYRVHYVSAKIVDGKLNVGVAGFGNSFPFRNNRIVVVAWCTALFADGTRLQAESVNMQGTGLFTYLFGREELPTALYLVPYEDESQELLLWQAEEAVKNDAAETPAASPVLFAWKGYAMALPFMTADLAGMRLSDYQGSMALVRLAAAEGTFDYSAFHQTLFVLTDPEGNSHSCRFYMPGASTVQPFTGLHLPASEQPHIDLLFELPDPTADRLAASTLTVYEEEGGEGQVFALSNIPQTLE